MNEADPIQPSRLDDCPRHVAIIMDGNGRWAKNRHMPRIAGHRAGLKSVRSTVRQCAKLGVQVLTLFAFSSENWRRPTKEVSLLMDLFSYALNNEVEKLFSNNVRLHVIGARQRFSNKLNKLIDAALERTAQNTGLNLVIAVDYGGRWEIAEAAKTVTQRCLDGEITVDQIDEQMLGSTMYLASMPEPDLFIRTGGEKRVSNFLLWHLAYTELYFTDTLWPDFDENAFSQAIASFSQRQRRFGLTGDQIEKLKGA